MKQIFNTAILMIVMMTAVLPAAASNHSAWINDAMSAARPEKSGDGVKSSDGDQLDPSEFLPPGTPEEQDMVDDAQNSYGDDSALVGASESANQFLAGGGSNNSSSQAFEIVNQEIGFETEIEHKIYQHSVLYSHDLNSNINTNYYGIAWHDHANTASSSVSTGDSFFVTPIPSGKKRSLIAMFAAPVQYGHCENPQVKITGGTHWVPGCSAPGANCERIINDPLSSNLYSYSAYESRWWQWTDNNGNVILTVPNSTGGISAYGGVLHFPRKEMRDQTSLAHMRNTIGVRKVEASGICDHPNPSEDAYYIDSLPSCDSPTLAHGDECGKVTRTRTTTEPNPFAAIDIDQQLNGMMQDCQIITDDVNQPVTVTETELKFCERSQSETFEGCTLQHNISVTSSLQWTHPGQQGQQEMVYEVTDSWVGTNRCKSLLADVSTYQNMCSYNLSYQAPTCRTIDGKQICEGDPLYSDLTSAPGNIGNRLTPSITISDVTCDPYQGTTNYNGEEYDLEPFNTCAPLESDSACQKIRTECINNVSTSLGSWCSEVQDVYECEEETPTTTTTETSTRMVCGNQEFYCTDGSCLDQQDTAASNGFAQAAAMLSAVQGIASHTECSDPTDPSTCQIFEGKAQACRKGRGKWQDLWNCCDIAGGEDLLDENNYVEAILNDGAEELFIGPNVVAFFGAAEMLLTFFVPCNDDEIELATSTEIDAAVYMGSYCGDKISLGFTDICIRRDRMYCAWPTALGKVIMEQARPQLGLGWGNPPKYPNCSGLTISQLGNLDWSQIDLSDWANKLIETGNLPKSDFSDIGTDPNAWTPDANPGGVNW